MTSFAILKHPSATGRRLEEMRPVWTSEEAILLVEPEVNKCRAVGEQLPWESTL